MNINMHLFSDLRVNNTYPQVIVNTCVNLPEPSLIYRKGESIFGLVLSAHSSEGICYLVFYDNEDSAIQEMKNSLPWVESWVASDEAYHLPMEGEVNVCLTGTEFQNAVWQTLLQIPAGTILSYEALAQQMGLDVSHARAVGTAVGSNRIAWLVPCHRVLGKNGKLTGFRWGVKRKQKILQYEHGI